MTRLELLSPQRGTSQRKVDKLEKLVHLLLEDKVIGNVVKGPLRVPATNVTGRAFA